MRIKKTSQYMNGGASLSNVYGTSNENGYTQEYVNKLSIPTTIYDQDNLVIKKCGNVVNVYSKGFINQGVLENYELPEAIRPSTAIILAGIAVVGGTLVSRGVSYGTSSHKFAVRGTDGASTTSYTSITFSVTYFVD